MSPTPTIYCFINNAFGPSDVTVVAVAEDGTKLAHHVSSSKGFAQSDIGYTNWQEGGVGIGAAKHDRYREHYPEGFTMEWVDAPKEHAGLLAAFERNKAMHEHALADDETGEA
jgi:hypothetical protein